MLSKQPVLTKTVIKDHKIGDFTYGEPKIYGKGTVEIGKFCSIAGNVLLLLGCEHNTKWATTYPFPALFREAQHIAGHPFSKGPIRIGHDVWIGQNATILSGVTIGNGAVIGAEAVVSHDVDPYSIVAGNPAKHIKFRFAENWVDYLNRKLKWWDWPIELILENIHALLVEPGEHLFDVRKNVTKQLLKKDNE